MPSSLFYQVLARQAAKQLADTLGSTFENKPLERVGTVVTSSMINISGMRYPLTDALDVPAGSQLKVINVRRPADAIYSPGRGGATSVTGGDGSARNGVTSVDAGNGLTGGGTGDIRLDVGEGPGIDVTTDAVGLGGDTILLYDAGGDPVREYAADQYGLTAALGDAASGDSIVCPSQITIACTAAITIPAGVMLSGADLTFSGFSGAAVTLAAGSALQSSTITQDGTGYAAATAVYSFGVVAGLIGVNGYAANATTNIGLHLKGAGTGASRLNATTCYGNAQNGTTSIGIKIEDDVRIKSSQGEANGASASNIGVLFAIASLGIDDVFSDGWGLATGTASYGIDVSGVANIMGADAYGATKGMRVQGGATATVSDVHVSSLTNLGTLQGVLQVGNDLYVGDGILLDNSDANYLNMTSQTADHDFKLLIQANGTPVAGDTAIHVYYDRGAGQRFLGLGAVHGGNIFLLGTGDGGDALGVLPLKFFHEHGATRTDVAQIDDVSHWRFLKSIDVDEIAAPAAPAANTARIYCRDAGGTTKLYYKRSDNTEVELGGLVTLPDHDHTGDAGDGGTIHHGALTGLGDNDHPQYQLASKHWEPVTNGDPVTPEIVFHEGDVVMAEV